MITSEWLGTRIQFVEFAVYHGFLQLFFLVELLQFSRELK